MEILYIITMIQIILNFFQFHLKNEKEMKGGVKLGMSKKMPKMKSIPDGGVKKESDVKSDKVKKNPLFMERDKDGKIRYLSAKRKDSIKSSFRTLAGLNTKSEKIKNADAMIALYKIVKIFVYFLSLFLIPFMPFYAATKSFFTKAVPTFKEVIIPESVDYEQKAIERQVEQKTES